MAQRILPGAYASLNDKSYVPEGQTALTVGYVLQADRGPVNQAQLVTSPTDFLTKYTFSGKPSVTSDPTFHSILKVLPQTNTMYVTRAAKDPVDGGPGYGGVIVRKMVHLGTITGANKANNTFTVTEVSTDSAGWFGPGGTVVVLGTGKNGASGVNDGYYTISTITNGDTDDSKKITVRENIVEDGTYSSAKTTMYTNPILPLTSFGLGAIYAANSTTRTFTFEGNSNITRLAVGSRFTITGDPEGTNNGSFTITEIGEIQDNLVPVKVLETIANATNDDLGAVISATASTHTIVFNTSSSTEKLTQGSRIKVTGAVETANNKTYTVASVGSAQGGQTPVVVREDIVDASGSGNHGTAILLNSHGSATIQSLPTPNGFEFSPRNSDHLMIITGIDPGAYNGKLAFAITSSEDNPDDMVYYPGAPIGDGTCTFGTMRLDVYNSDTNEPLESFTFSRDETATSIDGRSLFVDNVVAGSAYIKIVNNKAAEGLPYSTIPSKPIVSTGGYDGLPVDADTLAATAERVYNDKTLPISILGNGCSAAAETDAFQRKLLSITNDRKDCFVFLNSRTEDENKTLPSDRASSIVSYKKETLVSTSFYGCMYAPHVNTTDVYNQRQVKIGAEAVAIAGWLDVIGNLNYPYAYAGPRNGLVQGVTCDWKIGDMSGEAEVLNDASINYVAYDGKVGRYYMQCQNTLQVANSSMRNIGTVLNVLDIKEHFVTLLKEYLQLPITDDLRREIIDVSNDYLSPMLGVRFSNYSFQDVTSDIDLADNTLRYLLTIAPTPYAQKIYLVMNIVNATFDFSILQSM